MRMQVVSSQKESNTGERKGEQTALTPNASDKRYRLGFGLSLLVVLVFALALRLPAISAGLPYFYNEDEAHHFNRVVEMLQRGSYDPQYFHKPSLHFYLRMPVLAASFLWTVRQGQIKSIQEIRTKDPHGLSGYSLTASHPSIVKWNRLFSVLCSLGIIALAFWLTMIISNSGVASLFTALLLCCSPGLIEYSAVIGVDMPTAFFCTATVLAAVLHLQNTKLVSLLCACVCAGLAVSTKYNALPIAFLPILACVLSQRLTPARLGIALLLPGCAFFLASPFILVTPHLFLDHFAYEIWHYGVASHSGHSAAPGLAQALFYGEWLLSDAIGTIAAVLCVIGTCTLLNRPRIAVVLLFFPITYGLLMVAQRTHFERNMLLIVGVIPVLAAIGLASLLSFAKKNSVLRALVFLLALTAPILLLTKSRIIHDKSDTPRDDSRSIAHTWLLENTPALFDTAIAGSLQLPLFRIYDKGTAIQTLRGIKRLDLNKYSAGELFQLGFQRIVLAANTPLNPTPLWQEEHFIPGINQPQRVVKNPAIQSYTFTEVLLNQPITILNQLQLDNTVIPELTLPCHSPTEGHCWIQRRLTKLDLRDREFRMQGMSPWGAQEVRFFSDTGKWQHAITLDRDWSDIAFHIPEQQGSLYVLLPHVHVPAHHGDSGDSRRLGIALRSSPSQ